LIFAEKETAWDFCKMCFRPKNGYSA